MQISTGGFGPSSFREVYVEETKVFEKVDANGDKIQIVADQNRMTRIASFDAVPVMTQAQFERMQGNNGWSKSRATRTIGEVPLEEFFNLQWKADQNQEELTGTRLRKFLEEKPQYKTCDNILTKGRSEGPLIVVK